MRILKGGKRGVVIVQSVRKKGETSHWSSCDGVDSKGEGGIPAKAMGNQTELKPADLNRSKRNPRKKKNQR